MFNFFKTRQTPNAIPTGPDGERAYIIGDIHGCMDALEQLLHKIETYENTQAEAKTSLIFLGDLIDRGPNSFEVVDFLQSYTPDFASLTFLMGNHEEIFLSILGGNSDLIASWFEFGGRDCARSYKINDLGQVNIDPTPLLHQLQANVPKHHRDFISSFKNYHIFGDFMCVHAGIRPKTKLANQKSRDFRWIREPFLSYTKKTLSHHCPWTYDR